MPSCPEGASANPSKLSGWWLTYPSEKYDSVGMMIPNIWKNKKCLKPPTSYGCEIGHFLWGKLTSGFERPLFLPGLVMTVTVCELENGPVEIVDLPIDSIVILQSYVQLPEGNGFEHSNIGRERKTRMASFGSSERTKITMLQPPNPFE